MLIQRSCKPVSQINRMRPIIISCVIYNIKLHFIFCQFICLHNLFDQISADFETNARAHIHYIGFFINGQVFCLSIRSYDKQQ